MYPRTFIAEVVQSIETGVVVQDVVFVSQIFQPLTTPVTFLSVDINGAKESEQPRGPLAVRTHEISQIVVSSLRQQ